ncbi:MAG: hypothetical protein WAX89_01520 [Alphaproteobacteria bacterium]
MKTLLRMIIAFAIVLTATAAMANEGSATRIKVAKVAHSAGDKFLTLCDEQEKCVSLKRNYWLGWSTRWNMFYLARNSEQDWGGMYYSFDGKVLCLYPLKKPSHNRIDGYCEPFKRN